MIQQSPRASSDVQVRTRCSNPAAPIISNLQLRALPFPGMRVARETVVEAQPDIVHLDLSSLQCFEAVDGQYEDSGILFKNTIAVRPSNPSFLSEPNQTVLMGAPKSGLLDATFLRPAKLVSVSLTGSRRTVLTGFNTEGAIADKAEMATGNLLDSNSDYPVNHSLCLCSSKGIQRIRIRSIGGQFTVSTIVFAAV